MKTMTCKQLGGACDKKFHADSFEEIERLIKKHNLAMSEEGDERHIKAMNEMKETMKDPIAMNEWLMKKKKEFNALSTDPVRD